MTKNTSTPTNPPVNGAWEAVIEQHQSDCDRTHTLDIGPKSVANCPTLICGGRWSRASEHSERIFGRSRGLCRLQRRLAVTQVG